MNLSFKEDHISKIPAIKLLQNLGWSYLSHEEVKQLRKDNNTNVLLEPILQEQIQIINSNNISGRKSERFSDQNITTAIERLKTLNTSEGYYSTCGEVYDLLIFGTTVRQTVDTSTKDLSLHYIDWQHPERNVYHVADEFDVIRTGRSETYRPDLVLFINGIPICVIEAKRPDIKDSISQAISQQLRNQQEDGIRSLFYYTGLLLCINTNDAKYGTNGTPEKFWSVWHEQFASREEEHIYNDALEKIVNTPLSPDVKAKLFSAHEYSYILDLYFAQQESEHIMPSPQDKALFSLCSPKRLTSMLYSFTLFDDKVRKIARYQQYFAIQKTMERLHHIEAGKRKGGVIWHTQGSGKSLTMVMLSRAIVEETRKASSNIKNPKIIIITDRTDLDSQITDTLRFCDVTVNNATTGIGLAKLLEANGDAVITTLVHKFKTAVKEIKKPLESHNIFVIIDEGHRSQYGEMAIAMEKAMPNACFVAMTGTPLMKKDKSTAERFGGIIRPPYTVMQAVKDGTVVPLLYEGRHAFQNVSEDQIDKYFDLVTEGFTKEEKADFKRKFSNKNHLNIADQKIMAIAWDISVHFQKNWQGTGFKAQLVCQSKEAAVKYKNYFDEIGRVSAEVVISSPDMRESEEDVFESSSDVVKAFYKKMMDKYGKPAQYEKAIIESFKNSPNPEIIIVVSKLTTGFDVPANTILYITKNMQEHELLQTTARVNRVCEGKDFGYIVDYYGVLKALYDALEMYSNEEDAELIGDINSTFTDIAVEIKKLPQYHSELCDLFKTIKNKQDLEAYQDYLRDEAVRAEFYEKLTAYAKCLKIALSSIDFHKSTEEKQIKKYKSDLDMYLKLRRAVQERYAETIDYKKYEVKIQNLIDKHVTTTNVEVVTELVNIFDKEKFEYEVEKIENKAAKADTIAHRTAKYIADKMNEDPVFYEKFSRMLRDTIEAYERDRDAEKYLLSSIEIMNAVRSHTDNDIPTDIRDNDVARAFYGLNYELFKEKIKDTPLCVEVSKAVALKIEAVVKSAIVVDWKIKKDLIDRILLDIEDYYIDEIRDKHDLTLSFDEIDAVTLKCMDVAKLLL